MCPDWHAGGRLVIHFSVSLGAALDLGLILPHLLSLPVGLAVILPALWSSVISVLPVWPCFIITVRDQMVTFRWGWMGACLLPHFSALHVDFEASARTFMCTFVTVGFHYPNLV